ncbi:hypothetical protein QBE52_05380 [Clostridiaceae bacterium 35-E11]
MNRICNISVLLVIMTIFLGGSVTKAFTHEAEKTLVHDFIYKPAKMNTSSMYQCAI